MKKRTETAPAATATATAADRSPSETSTTKDNGNMMASEEMDIMNPDAAAPQAQAAAAAAAAPEGLNLLFAASQSQAEDKESDAHAHGAKAEVPSTITVGSNEPIAIAGDEDESGGNEPENENLTTAALKIQEESFPQVLHEILATPECQSIIHWLPDGLSFIIADKERFSSEILPKYFREALLNSVIRKLNRWGFRRVKSRRKGEESSFAHSNFVRDKPWLCLRMKCKSKPTYHKVKVSPTSTKKKSKNNKKGRKQSTSEASNRNILANAATASVVVHAPAQAPPPILAASGIMNRTFGPTSTCSRVTTAEHEPLPLPNPIPAFRTVTAPAAGSLSAAVASTIQERQYLASAPLYLYHQQQRIYQERQILVAQMRQRHQFQMELQRLNDMSSHIGEQIASSRNGNGNIQSAMMAQYARDMWNGRKIYYGGERNCGCAIVAKPQEQERSHYNYIAIADIDADALKATPLVVLDLYSCVLLLRSLSWGLTF
eukprot:scaffold10013_cov79-Skeletonema_dohrnii-CCMP3373.AAC.1